VSPEQKQIVLYGLDGSLSDFVAQRLKKYRGAIDGQNRITDIRERNRVRSKSGSQIDGLLTLRWAWANGIDLGSTARNRGVHAACHPKVDRGQMACVMVHH
jgi:hypothetical protein